MADNSARSTGAAAKGVSYGQAAASDGPTSEQNRGASSSAPAKKRKHRGGKKRRNRRQSFAATAGTLPTDDADEPRPSLAPPQASSSFYRLQGNHSNTSLESEALLDHRDQSFLQARRQSVQVRPSPQKEGLRSKLARQQRQTDSEVDDDDDADDHTPLMSSSNRDLRPGSGYGGLSTTGSAGRARRGSRSSHNSANNIRRPAFTQHYSNTNLNEYDVNNPPSVPASPVLGPDVGFDDVMLSADLERSRSDDASRNRSRDVLIDIDEEPSQNQYADSEPPSPRGPNDFRRRMTQLQAAEDVCFPLEGMSEIGQEDYHRTESEEPRRRRRRRWPDLDVLEAWSHEEKEQRTIEGMRTRKVSEPLMVGGRLRPQKRPWHREADDAPYRFTYFNEEFDNTVHSQTISELVQPGQTFRDLFIPEPPVIEESSDSETDEDEMIPLTRDATLNGSARLDPRASSKLGHVKQGSSGEQTRSSTPTGSSTPTPKPDQEKRKRLGPRPAFWLDVLSPTDAEMKVISKAFSIHPLTAEDILMQEAREKVELFKHYYFINYRTFEQDENNEDYLEPVNLYVVVFREGVISFHFSMTPHPANVRRRIRQLQDYLILSPDWISYGIIDDITDAYAPLIQRIEEEVDDIDEAILRLHSDEDEQENEKSRNGSTTNPLLEKLLEGSKEPQESGRDMLRRVGECRKKVMSLYRLLGNKADVIKGFAKRCNEQWDVAPRSEIGLYLGDIQDHIVTMTANLSHYEK
jgi:magnesium transporter